MSDVQVMVLCPIVLIHLFYGLAVFKKDLSVIDTAWGLGFILISLAGCFLGQWKGPRENLIFVLVLIWGLRLAIFIHFRNHGKGEDFRYANWRKEWGDKTNLIAYFKVYWLQLILMLIVGLPIFVGHENPEVELNVFNYTGVVVWLIGILWEGTADFQKSRFKANQKNKDKVFQDGLWAYSRHPNYFGEALLWWGIALVSFHPQHYVGFIGSAFITFMLLKVSGVPMVEKKQEHNPEYQIYASHTPVFLPSPTKILKSLV